jgi:hypothetical protein
VESLTSQSTTVKILLDYEYNGGCRNTLSSFDKLSIKQTYKNPAEPMPCRVALAQRQPLRWEL